MMNKLLIPQWFKKYPLNLRVKLRFFNSTVKPISYPSCPHLPHGFRYYINMDITITTKADILVRPFWLFLHLLRDCPKIGVVAREG